MAICFPLNIVKGPERDSRVPAPSEESRILRIESNAPRLVVFERLKCEAPVLPPTFNHSITGHGPDK
jgi:hypothetical protein